MGMCRKRITGSLSQVVSWAARVGVRVNQRSGSRLFEPVSCPETSICFSEPAGCGPFTSDWAYLYGNVAGSHPSDLQGMGLLQAQTVTAQVWLDADDDNLIDAGEVQSNVLTINVTGSLPE